MTDRIRCRPAHHWATSQQTMFIRDHVYDRPRSWRTIFETDHVHNRRRL